MSRANYICVTCGTQFAESDSPPAECLICLDERQYVGYSGQQWTTLAELAATHTNDFRAIEPGLTGIVSLPHIAIFQRAILVQSPFGNTLWDCITLLDDATIESVRALGGIRQIAISHPHYYSGMVEWSRAFDAPIYIHESEREYVMRPDPAVHFWQGETLTLNDETTLIRCGGHYEGAQVLHWSGAPDGKGVLLTGDTIYVVQDRRYVSFMYSYPNMIPLSPRKVQHIVDAVESYDFDRLYSFRFDLDIKQNAKVAVQESARRYIAAITET